MTENQLAVLSEVEAIGPASAREVAHALQMWDTTVRRALRWLEDKAFVESDDYQKRTRIYMTTEEGTKACRV